MDGWEKQASKFLQIPSGHVPNPLGQTRVQFHQDLTRLLAVHGTQIAIYEAPKLECLKQVDRPCFDVLRFMFQILANFPLV